MRFAGKTAIVTGGSRGIGRACAARLAAEGANVAIVYRNNQEAAEALVAELQSAHGQLRALQADVRDLARAHEIVDQFDQLDRLKLGPGRPGEEHHVGDHLVDPHRLGANQR